YGGEVSLSPVEEGFAGAVMRARARVAETPGAWTPALWEVGADEAEGYTGALGDELWAAATHDARATLDAFVMGVGDGLIVAGAGGRLKALCPSMRLVAVEPSASAVLAGDPPRPHRIQGLGLGLVPRAVRERPPDAAMTVSDREAWAMCQRLAREEGLLVGISTGAQVAAAVALAAELGPARAIYTLACDTGERYFSLAELFTSTEGP
ncbi:MAG TPA: pyridoxal-phosphate dependent enzyme, partial [Myxococcaceae bacterium]|nr:pyridoxal-phosphate dependent enzyme [Myxococcaceae bacterium]